jgi:hypothetical protein
MYVCLVTELTSPADIWQVPSNKIGQALRELVVVSRDLRAAHDDDIGRSRHHRCLDNLVLVRPRDVSEHHSHDFRNKANNRRLALLPGLRRI